MLTCEGMLLGPSLPYTYPSARAGCCGTCFSGWQEWRLAPGCVGGGQWGWTHCLSTKARGGFSHRALIDGILKGGGAKTAPPDVRLLHNTLPLCVSGMWKCEGQHSSDCVTLCESPKQQTGESPEGFEEVSSPPVEKARWLGPEDNPSA